MVDPRQSSSRPDTPIALLSSLAKILTSLVAEIINDLEEAHHPLPKNHFRGRTGQATMDAIHYLVRKIKMAWRDYQVVSVLFLDVEGMFLDTVTSRLLHNLKKRRIPLVLVKFISWQRKN
jgi:hypothetical protein